MAASFGDIANILKQEIVQRDLVPIFEKFFEDVTKIKYSVILNMPKFLRNLEPDLRDDYFYKIKAYTDIYGKNWRGKLEAAKLLFKFHNVFDNEFTYQIIIPICINLCVDEVV